MTTTREAAWFTAAAGTMILIGGALNRSAWLAALGAGIALGAYLTARAETRPHDR
jgi:hypothetical protein